MKKNVSVLDVLNRLATAVEVPATKQDSMEKSINRLTA